MKSYKMLATVQGARDGLIVETFKKGQIYDLPEHLAENFYHQGAVEEVAAISSGNPADSRATKVSGPTEKKITGPTEIKEGEAGVDLGTQNIEELVALARDTYGLEVDTTMSEDDVRTLIEMAREEAEGDETKKKTKKAKK